MIEKYKLFVGLFFSAMWILLTFGFISEELMPPLIGLRSYVFLLCDLIFLALGLFVMRNKRDLIVFCSFLIIGAIASYLNNLELVYIVNGFRDFLGLFFAIPIFRFLLGSRYRDRFIASFDKQLFLFLVLQTVCVTWQFLRYGPGDHGGGSMGNGFSGIVSTLIYIISFYLLSKRWTFGNYWSKLSENKIYLILLFPSFLNETKISFIFLLAYFLLLLPVEWKTVFKIIVSLPLIFCGIIFAGYLYLVITGQSFESVFSETAMNDYMVGEDPEELIELGMAIQDAIHDEEDIGIVDIPRFSKLVLVPPALEDAAGGIVFGAGLGQFKGGTTLAYTPYAETWHWLLSGSIPFAFAILIQMGILGVIWLFFNLITVLLPRSKCLLGRNIKIFIWIILILLMFYNDSLRFFPFTAILFYITLRGYVNVPNNEITEQSQQDESAA